MEVIGHPVVFAATFAIEDSTLHNLLWIIAICLFLYGLIGEGLQRGNWGKGIVLMVVALLIGPGGVSIFT